MLAAAAPLAAPSAGGGGRAPCPRAGRGGRAARAAEPARRAATCGPGAALEPHDLSLSLSFAHRPAAWGWLGAAAAGSQS